nr:hypothetical protein GCM10010200_099310 [Actinomadura rugatobispora]
MRVFPIRAAELPLGGPARARLGEAGPVCGRGVRRVVQGSSAGGAGKARNRVSIVRAPGGRLPSGRL